MSFRIQVRPARLAMLVALLVTAVLVIQIGAADGRSKRDGHSAGEVQRSFGHHGRRAIKAFPRCASARGVALQRDGRIVAVGDAESCLSTPETPPSSDFTLARIRSGGRMDRSFGRKGKVRLGDSSQAYAEDVALQPDGKIVTVGDRFDTRDRGREGILTRHRRGGRLDRSFGDGGVLRLDIGGFREGVAVQPNGRILVGSGSELARYRRGGRPDRSFGEGGVVELPVGNAETLELQPDGKVLVAEDVSGDTGDSTFAVARYERDGSPDGSFGDGGVASADFGGDEQAAQAVALQPDGAIVVAGSTYERASRSRLESDFAVARFAPDGELDRDFGRRGKITTDFADDEEATDVAVDRAGRPVVVGRLSIRKRDHVYGALARYRPNGRHDRSFSGNGKERSRVGGPNAALALEPDDDVVVAGQAKRGFTVTRYLGHKRR